MTDQGARSTVDMQPNSTRHDAGSNPAGRSTDHLPSKEHVSLADFIEIMREPVELQDWMRQYIIDALTELEHYKRRVEELSIHAEKWVKRALTPAHEREPPHCSTCACGVERPLAAGDPVSYLGVETTIREVRTSYILAGGSYATADLLVRRAAQPPGADQ